MQLVGPAGDLADQELQCPPLSRAGEPSKLRTFGKSGEGAFDGATACRQIPGVAYGIGQFIFLALLNPEWVRRREG